MDKFRTELHDLLLAFQRDVHRTNQEKGFYDQKTSFAHKVALAHTELSEAVEADRLRPGEFHDHKQESVAEELADCIIRILDMAQAHNLPVVAAMLDKAERNKRRPKLHGKLY